MLRSRIAPTPSGFLHSGNAINFTLAWLMVRKENGALRLRIDDLDAPRMNKEYIEDIFRTLEWLGMNWDEGPQGPDEHQRSFSQQLRIPRYNELIEKLGEKAQVFSCACSRKQIHELSTDGQYPGICRDKSLQRDTKDAALRILVPADTIIPVHDLHSGVIDVDLYKENRDFVIRRKDGIPAYHIASLADDVDQQINFIVRGEDLLQSTVSQLYLAQLLQLDAFTRSGFYHHPLIRDEKGDKLSKSAGSASIRSWRERGIKAEEFFLMLSQMLGWKEEATSLNEMLQLARGGHTLFLKN
jgi:glutamyl-tRNA synthetase